MVKRRFLFMAGEFVDEHLQGQGVDGHGVVVAPEVGVVVALAEGAHECLGPYGEGVGGEGFGDGGEVGQRPFDALLPPLLGLADEA